MRYLIILATFLTFFMSCKRNSEVFFNDQPSIYFQGDRDIDFTFSKYRSSEVTLHIPVEIGGYSKSIDRNFSLQVLPDSTTAVEGMHYKITMPVITMPADSFKIHIPIRLMNTDPKLKNEKVRLYLRLQPNENFVSGIYNKQDLSLYISDILIKPKIWDAVYSGFFGTYSQAKHRKILEIANITEIPDVYDGGSYNYKWDAYGRAVNNYYKEFYPQYDENNQVIEPWM